MGWGPAPWWPVELGTLSAGPACPPDFGQVPPVCAVCLAAAPLVPSPSPAAGVKFKMFMCLWYTCMVLFRTVISFASTGCFDTWVT